MAAMEQTILKYFHSRTVIYQHSYHYDLRCHFFITCICRRKNRSCTDFEPHLAGKITAVFHMDFWEYHVENLWKNRCNYF